MNPAFLDTVGLLAMWDRDDRWHLAAAPTFAALIAARVPILTTTFVLAECANAAARKPYRLAVDDLRALLATKGGLVIPTDEDWDAAWAAYRRGDAGECRNRRPDLLRRDAAIGRHPGVHQRQALPGGGAGDTVLIDPDNPRASAAAARPSD